MTTWSWVDEGLHEQTRAFRRENTDSITITLPNKKSAFSAVAVDTTQPYKEIDLGVMKPGQQTWTAPHTSDWAVAVEEKR